MVYHPPSIYPNEATYHAHVPKNRDTYDSQCDASLVEEDLFIVSERNAVVRQSSPDRSDADVSYGKECVGGSQLRRQPGKY